MLGPGSADHGTGDTGTSRGDRCAAGFEHDHSSDHECAAQKLFCAEPLGEDQEAEDGSQRRLDRGDDARARCSQELDSPEEGHHADDGDQADRDDQCERGDGGVELDAVSETVREPWQFGAPGRDPVEIGRKGGHASVLARRLAGQRKLEKRIEESRSGAALYALLRVRMERERELEHQRIEADCELVELEAWAGQARIDLEEAIEQREQVEAELQQLQARPDAAKDGDHDALVELLRGLGEEAVERACDELGWIEDVPAS